LLSKDELEQHVRLESSGKALLYFSMPSKKEILDLFVANEGGGLVGALVARLDVMARFVPVLDALLEYQSSPDRHSTPAAVDPSGRR